MNHIPWLTLVMLLPAGAALILLAVPRGSTGLVKAIALGLLIAFTHNPGSGPLIPGVGGGRPAPLTFQFEEQHDWISQIGASYHLGLDGVSAWLLGLDVVVFLLGAVVMTSRSIDRFKFYAGLLLLTETATIGVLLSVDLLLFYVFWEAMLIPLYFLLSSYGDARLRGPATLKFIIYTVAGSLLMLLSIIYIYFQSPPPAGLHQSFDLQALLVNSPIGQDPVTLPFHLGSLGADIKLLTPLQFAFVGFVLAFAIKVPLVPFHTWLPDSYESCPPAALTFFAGIVSKLGAFGFIRYGLTLFPGPVRDFHWILEGLAVLSILYGALMALAQTDIKRIVAYSSISHLGFVVLGIFSLNQNGLNGAVIQMVNHGIIIASLFLIVGIIEERTGTRDRHQLAGLERRMPWLYGFFLVVTLAGLGMPGMNSFVGEFTIMLGAWQASPILAVLAGFGVVLACWYMLRLHQGLMHEPLRPHTESVRDIGTGWRLVLVPMVGLMLVIGLFPRPIGDIARTNVGQYISLATQTTAPAAAQNSP